MTSPPLSEGPSPEPSTENLAKAREILRADDFVNDCIGDDDGSLRTAIIRVIAFGLDAAKRSAHLEDARALCEYCADPSRYEPAHAHGANRNWAHYLVPRPEVGIVGIGMVFCKVPRAIWDALSLLPPEQK